MIPGGGDPIYPVPINSVKNSSHAILVEPKHEKRYSVLLYTGNQPVQSIVQEKKNDCFADFTTYSDCQDSCWGIVM